MSYQTQKDTEGAANINESRTFRLAVISDLRGFENP
jgi:hypothetical protein